MFDPTSMLTAPQAAARLGMERKSVTRAIREGRLKAYRFGRFWIVPVEAVDAYRKQYNRRAGRPVGRRDSYQRVRRTRYELEQAG